MLPSYNQESYSDYEWQQSNFCERFEARTHFISELNTNVVPNRTVVVDSD